MRQRKRILLSISFRRGYLLASTEGFGCSGLSVSSRFVSAGTDFCSAFIKVMRKVMDMAEKVVGKAADVIREISEETQNTVHANLPKQLWTVTVLLHGFLYPVRDLRLF